MNLNTIIKYEIVELPLDSQLIKLNVNQLKSIDETIDQLFEKFSDETNTKQVEDLCPYFGIPWPSGIALAEYLVERQEGLNNKRILELGCGLALPSLALAKCGLRVHCTDFHPDVPYFLNLNMTANCLKNIDFYSVDWRLPANIEDKFDVIIASDVLYDKEQPEALLATVEKLLKPGGLFYLADPGRPYIDLFIKMAKELKFHVKEDVHRNIFHFEISAPK